VSAGAGEGKQKDLTVRSNSNQPGGL